MTDALMIIGVVLVLAGITAALATGYPRAMRTWVWFAFFEYLVCAVAQLLYSRVVTDGGDSFYYASSGTEFARFLDTSFSWSSRELLSMLFQQPSAFDNLIFTPESNTGSMIAVSAFLVFFLRGSEFAAHFLVAGFSLFGTLSIYKAMTEAYPEGSPVRMFVASVLFPSVAFWTSALHKEAFAVAGIGALLAAWRSAHKKRFRALVYAPLGVTLILLFRAPALPPLLLGIAIFIGWDRLRKSRGADTVLLAPVYLVLAIGALVVGIIAVGRASPGLAVDRLAETVATSQRAWTVVQGGSSFANDDVIPQTLGGQLLRVPVALLNSLFRPQLFDVHNFATLLSALEMTTITYLVYRAVRNHGIVGVFVRIQRSPFLLMCVIVTVVGCAMVGLVTFNFGSLARYRVPFLPFYGALVAALSPAAAKSPEAMAHGSVTTAAKRRIARRRTRPLAR